MPLSWLWLTNSVASFQAFRSRACQSLSATVKQEQPDKPIRIDWEKRGERQIMMAPDDVWEKWEEVFVKFESGQLIDLDTRQEVKHSQNAKDLTNLAHITPTVLRGLNSLSMDQVGEAADHILSNPPKIYVGKGFKNWHQALSLDKWCERRKWKDVLVRAIGDRISYFNRKKKNIFFDDHNRMKVDVWRAWKQRKLFSSCIMQAIYFSTGAELFVSETMSVNRKTPEYPPPDCLQAIDQALVNDERAAAVAANNWSVFVQWKATATRFSGETMCFGCDGKLVNDGPRKLRRSKLTAGIIDLRHFPLISDVSEETTSWSDLIERLRVRAETVGFKSIKAWMIVAPRTRQNVVELLRRQFFPNFRCKHVQYSYHGGEPLGKTKTADLDEVTYLESGTELQNGEVKYFSETVAYERLFSRQFEKHEFYKAEHRGVLWQDELRMETYVRFLARHTYDDDNVLLAFAGSKAIRACRVSESTATLSFRHSPYFNCAWLRT